MLSAERPILGVDLDNVLAFTDPLIRRLVKEMFGVCLEQTDIIYFDYWRCGITREQDQLIFARFHETECEFIVPIDEAVDALQSLRDHFEIHIVTGRPPEARKLTVNWLKKNNILYDRLDFLKRKNESQINFKAFVDDHRETAYAMVSRGVRSFLFDYPWNRAESIDPPNLIRVKSWKEISRYLEEFIT